MTEQFAASGFRSELEKLINKHSMENGSGTPDFILADYLVACLLAFDSAVGKREKWYRVPGAQKQEAP